MENRPHEIAIPQQTPPAAPPEEKKAGLVQKSMDFLGNAVNSLKGRDLHQLIEEFTAEMTLVAEGLSDDQTRMKEETAQLSARQTILEENGRALQGDVENTLRDMNKRLQEIERKVNNPKAPRATLSTILKQATWIAAILSAAWVITALLRTFGGR